MHDDSQHEIWNPFGVELSTLSVKEQIDIWRAQCWSIYLSGGPGEPRYFDYETYIRMVERE